MLLLDLDAEQGLERAASRSRRASASFDMSSLEPNSKNQDNSPEETWNRFEQQQLEFHKRVRKGFLTLAEDPTNNFAVLNAAKSEDEVIAAAREAVEKAIA